MKRVFLILCIILTYPFVVSAQKAFKPVKSALKSKNYHEVIKKVNALEHDSLFAGSSKLCLYKIEALRGLNDAENMKLYLKTKYDTVAFFSTTYQIITQTLRLDSIENQISVQTNKKSKYSGQIKSLLNIYFPNMHAASRFFYLKKNYIESMKYLRICLDVPHMPVGINAGLSHKFDVNNASLYLISAYQSKKYKEVHRYESLSLQDTLVRSSILECLINTAEAENNIQKYLQWLRVAWYEFPQNKKFFTKLADYYAAQNNYQEVLTLANYQASKDSTDCVASLAKCLALFNLEEFHECIQEGRKLLAKDSAYVEAKYYIGASYVAQGTAIEIPINALSNKYKEALEKQKFYYRLAQPFLEEYRQQKPNSPKRWAPLLYKIYLALNEGRKFEEIEKFL